MSTSTTTCPSTCRASQSDSDTLASSCSVSTTSSSSSSAELPDELNTVFDSQEAAKIAVSKLAQQEGFSTRTPVRQQGKMKLVCSSKSCTWNVFFSGSENVICTSFNCSHKCTLAGRLDRTDVLMEKLIPRVRDNDRVDIKSFRKQLKREGVQVSNDTVYRALQRAKQKVFGDEDSSYGQLASWLESVGFDDEDFSCSLDEDEEGRFKRVALTYEGTGQ
eukprot:TRINITY_DN2394_c0_g3_i1.p1 TRINITY_DN2394_c0_g3~~TRINITY_DN2394_c0_g3_i1.p1  ORF type:complete len:219 (+),score=33.93 TRINITY_DN2394_c0_g3_i1:456-1112(+)